MKKVFSIALMVVILLTIASSAVLALNPGSIAPVEDSTLSNDVQIITGKILQGIQYVGSAVSVIMLAFIGVKYLVGSAEAKAEYKKTFIPYIVGAILVFAASNLAGVVYDWSGSLTNTTTITNNDTNS